jgi:hypothetical protein
VGAFGVFGLLHYDSHAPIAATRDATQVLRDLSIGALPRGYRAAEKVAVITFMAAGSTLPADEQWWRGGLAAQR